MNILDIFFDFGKNFVETSCIFLENKIDQVVGESLKRNFSQTAGLGKSSNKNRKFETSV